MPKRSIDYALDVMQYLRQQNYEQGHVVPGEVILRGLRVRCAGTDKVLLRYIDYLVSIKLISITKPALALDDRGIDLSPIGIVSKTLYALDFEEADRLVGL